MAFPFSNNINEDDLEEYVLDNPIPTNFISRGGRFLSNANTVQKGAKCDPKAKVKKDNINVCNGVLANGAKSLLYCCKLKCQDILGDINNCGKCGKKCKHGQLCCNGVCTNIISNVKHCGKCGKRCQRGIECELGICGYA
ncbi:hypothetical protein FEM48_Zijuj12G0103600 [Ziziphus jujuba var. spinosa]|uniref:Protein GRIM REAPER-like n=1 Tax=Ziziphus jujuba var. spinosa TaxID=714518 RepID=A0A978UCR9_ZIZJJ|nr:hypothetical protein FEM48_Zijuj12G0103600 [Ziziphus jujuba var. spinosa]